MGQKRIKCFFQRGSYHSLEAAVQRRSEEKVFWKYATILQENTHAEVRFQKSCFATVDLLHIFSTLFLRISPNGCFWQLFSKPSIILIITLVLFCYPSEILMTFTDFKNFTFSYLCFLEICLRFLGNLL